MHLSKWIHEATQVSKLKVSQIYDRANRRQISYGAQNGKMKVLFPDDHGHDQDAITLLYVKNL